MAGRWRVWTRPYGPWEAGPWEAVDLYCDVASACRCDTFATHAEAIAYADDMARSR